jgi:prevent-host-death family protein
MYNTYDARNYLCELLERARCGEVIVIARAGQPIARLIPYREAEQLRPGVVRAHLVVREGPQPL